MLVHSMPSAEKGSHLDLDNGPHGEGLRRLIMLIGHNRRTGVIGRASR